MSYEILRVAALIIAGMIVGITLAGVIKLIYDIYRGRYG
jgi:hypothetical protein